MLKKIKLWNFIRKLNKEVRKDFRDVIISLYGDEGPGFWLQIQLKRFFTHLYIINNEKSNNVRGWSEVIKDLIKKGGF